MIRKAAPYWPSGIFVPEVGCYPPISPMRANERVLHLALKDAFEPQAALERALRSISSQYIQVDWQKIEHQPGGIEGAAQRAARDLHPTMVFLQIQRESTLPGAVIERLRPLCHPSCVILQWDGDMHNNPSDKGREWFIDLGRACDCNATVETGFQEQYLALGVRHPAYLQIGIDEQLYHPAEPTTGTPPIVLLASRYPGLEQECPGGYASRVRVARACEDAYGHAGFGIYGSGWNDHACRREFVRQSEEAGIYAAAKAALSLSIRKDLSRYTSDRLFRMMASGAVCFVEKIPDWEGLGLVDSKNCIMFDEWSDLRPRLDDAVDYPERYQNLRVAAAELGLEHTWSARAPEMLALIDAVREMRG